MPPRVEPPLHVILSVGTQVVTLVEVPAINGTIAHPRGAVGVIVASPTDQQHAYRVRFPDGFEAPLRRAQLVTLAQYKLGVMSPADETLAGGNLYDRVIYRCVVGSRAFGLDGDDSDTDRRGIYLPTAEMHWSLYGVPEQLENELTQEAYWELQKFVTMALKANPNILECLYTPLVEHATPLAQELLAMREAFLSRLVYQTYNGYVMSQFKKLQTDLRNQGAVKWKHVMHLIRLLISGVIVLREAYVPVRVEQHRDQLLSIRRGELPWDEVDAWRRVLHHEFSAALAASKLPEQPDYERVNDFFDSRPPRRVGGDAAMNPSTTPSPFTLPPSLADEVRAQPYPLLFVTISGAHLYGFPSPDSDFDLRGVHVLPAAEVAGLAPPRETIDSSGIREGVDGHRVEMDLVSHDVVKFMRLMLRNNGYVLEQLHSPLVVQTSPEHAELRELAAGCVTRNHAHHYLGFADTQWRLFHKQSPRRVKPLLYVYRVLLTGIHLMRSGETQANLLTLNEEARLPYIDDLVARKLSGPEKGTLPDGDVELHEREYVRLCDTLKSAHENSHLPEAPTTRQELNDLLVRIRLNGFAKS